MVKSEIKDSPRFHHSLFTIHSSYQPNGRSFVLSRFRAFVTLPPHPSSVRFRVPSVAKKRFKIQPQPNPIHPPVSCFNIVVFS